MDLNFEHNFQKKVMLQQFNSPTTLASDADVMVWRNKWMGELKSWHSPYKALIDCSNLSINRDDPKVKAAIDRLIKFFEGFFLKKTIGFGFDESKGHDLLPFQVHKEEGPAYDEAGLNKVATPRDQVDFRSSIQIQNHFNQHSVELTFSVDACIDSKEKMTALRSKLTNNLMQWHSKWNLIIDCHNLTIKQEFFPEFANMERFFKGLFLKQIIGYGNLEKNEYPFPHYRARHKAVAVLEGEGNQAGDDAICRSTPAAKPKTS